MSSSFLLRLSSCKDSSFRREDSKHVLFNIYGVIKNLFLFFFFISKNKEQGII